MGMVEQRINELLQAYAYIQAKRNAPLYDNTVGFEEQLRQSTQLNDEDKVAEEIQKQQEQIMMPGIFQHVGKMAGIGSIEPPSFDQNDEDDDDEEDEDFAQSRK